MNNSNPQILAAPAAATGILVMTFLLCGLGSVSAQTTVAEWQAKAVQEYPELARPSSQLNTKFRAKVAELKASNPAFFNDPKWPYTLAQSLTTQPSQVIPGVDIEAPYRMVKLTSDRTTLSQVYSAKSLADAVEKDPKAFKGKTVAVEGTVNGQYLAAMGDNKSFCSILEADVICEFTTASFYDSKRFEGSSWYYLLKKFPSPTGILEIRIRDGEVMVYRPESGSRFAPKDYKPVGKLLPVGEKVIILGTVEGQGMVGVGARGLILKNCAVASAIRGG